MSIHNGSEVWAGKDMLQHPTLGRGSGNLANDEGTNINWGFWLGKNLTTEEALNLMSKLEAELLSHTNVDVESDKPEWVPGRWWRAIDPSGTLWAESSDSREIKSLARPTDKVQRLFVTREQREWRDWDNG